MKRQETYFLLLIVVFFISILSNSRWLIFPSSLSYYAFIIVAGIMTVSIPFFLAKQEHFILRLPFLLFFTYGCHFVISSLFIGKVHAGEYYLGLCGVWLFAGTAVTSDRNRSLFVFALIIISAWQSVVCILQFFHVLPSMNVYFRVTGSWVNPNVIAMFFAVIFPLLLKECFSTTNKWLSVTVIFLVSWSVVLINCRTAYLGIVLSSLIMLFQGNGFQRWKGLVKKGPRTGFIALLFAVCLSFGYLLYQLKPVSAYGRLFIWKVSAKMISNRPFLGYGDGLFERNYNLAQANYLKNGKASLKERARASFVKMAYNELLQHLIEGGILGLSLLLFWSVSLLAVPILSKDYEWTGYRRACYAGIWAFSIMSLTNFTVQAVPVWGVIAFFASEIEQGIDPGRRYMSFTVGRKYLGICLVMVGGYLSYQNALILNAQVKHAKAAHLASKRLYLQALAKLDSIEAELSDQESFLLNKAMVLLHLHRPDKSLKLIEKASSFTSNPSLFIMRGSAYELKQKEELARNAYKQASFISPNSALPYFMLLQQAHKQHDDSLARKYATLILNLPYSPSNKRMVRYRLEASKAIYKEIN